MFVLFRQQIPLSAIDPVTARLLLEIEREYAETVEPLHQLREQAWAASHAAWAEAVALPPRSISVMPDQASASRDRLFDLIAEQRNQQLDEIADLIQQAAIRRARRIAAEIVQREARLSYLAVWQ